MNLHATFEEVWHQLKYRGEDEGLLSGNVTGRVRERARWRVGAQIIRIIVVERKWSDLGLARKCELK